MKFTNVVKGKRAEESIEVPGYKDEKGDPFVIILVPLTGLEYENACACARARALEKGVTTPGIGDPIYDLALMAFVIAVGCLDPDSPEEARTLSFESAIEVLDGLHPETIVYVHERHELHQMECSPHAHQIEGGEAGLYAAVSEVAGPDGRTTFMRWSPSMRLNYSLFMARRLKELWVFSTAKSTTGSGSPATGTSDDPKQLPPSKPNNDDEAKEVESPPPLVES